MKIYSVGLSAFLVLFGGCASRPTSLPPATSAPGVESHPRLSAAQILRAAAAEPARPFEGQGWQRMGNSNDLAGWRETAFAGRGEVQCEHGLVLLNIGDPFTGINWTQEFPRTNYEVGLDAMRVLGSDFFCGLTVPVGDSFCSLIVGGWGGGLVGISSIDGLDASENDTTKYMNFENGRWYRIRLRVTEKRIEAWIDGNEVINTDITGKRISLRPGDIELSKPFGLAAWETTAALRNIQMRRVGE